MTEPSNKNEKEKLKEIGLFSYGMEDKREKILLDQTAKLFTAISIFIVALLTFLSLGNMMQIQSLAILGLTSIFLIPCFISTILILWKFEY
ncbi:MAG: hypothetical protein LBE57_07545 [Methanosarcinales archaeon]|jgi:hypothetical protein|nr:hypothetical protein [Methanosarcinales archaeon]